MSTVKFTVIVTIPDSETATGEQRVEAFAKNRGWQAEVSSQVEETIQVEQPGEPDEEGNPTTVLVDKIISSTVMIPNPQTAADAVAAYFDGILQEQMTRDLVDQMNASLNVARLNGLAQIHAAAKEMIEIKIGE